MEDGQCDENERYPCNPEKRQNADNFLWIEQALCRRGIWTRSMLSGARNTLGAQGTLRELLKLARAARAAEPTTPDADGNKQKQTPPSPPTITTKPPATTRAKTTDKHTSNTNTNTTTTDNNNKNTPVAKSDAFLLTLAAALCPSLSVRALSALSLAMSAAGLPLLPTSATTASARVGLQILAVFDKPLWAFGRMEVTGSRECGREDAKQVYRASREGGGYPTVLEAEGVGGQR